MSSSPVHPKLAKTNFGCIQGFSFQSDALIKAWPTTPIALLTNPGGGFLTWPWAISLECTNRRGPDMFVDYTNINALAEINLIVGNIAGAPNIVVPIGTVTLDPHKILAGAPLNEVRSVLFEMKGSPSGGTDLTLELDNKGSGNLTGGNVDNILSMKLFYV